MPIPALLRAFVHSLSGLRFAMGSERAFRQEVVLLAVSIPAAFLLTGDPFRRAALVGSILAVMAVELLNTAIEKLCDHVTPERHEQVRAIKDMGSAAVFCALALAALLWGAAGVAFFGF